MQPTSFSKRSGRRVTLTRYLEVRDCASGELIGRLLNLSLSGMALISENPIASGRELRLRIVIPASDADSEPDHLEVDVESQWSAPDVNADFFDTGFRLLTHDQTLRQRIVKLAQQLGFQR